MHIKTREVLDGLSWHFIPNSFTKYCRTISVLICIGYFHRRSTRVSAHISVRTGRASQPLLQTFRELAANIQMPGHLKLTTCKRRQFLLSSCDARGTSCQRIRDDSCPARAHTWSSGGCSCPGQMHVLGTTDLQPHVPAHISTCGHSEIEFGQMTLTDVNTVANSVCTLLY